MKTDNYIVFSNGYADIKIDGKTGFINKKGGEVVKNVFASASSFKDGLARVTTVDNEWGYSNKKGAVS